MQSNLLNWFECFLSNQLFSCNNDVSKLFSVVNQAKTIAWSGIKISCSNWPNVNSIQIPYRGLYSGVAPDGSAGQRAGPPVAGLVVRVHISAWLENVQVARDTCAICGPTLRYFLFWNSVRFQQSFIAEHQPMRVTESFDFAKGARILEKLQSLPNFWSKNVRLLFSQNYFAINSWIPFIFFYHNSFVFFYHISRKRERNELWGCIKDIACLWRSVFIGPWGSAFLSMFHNDSNGYPKM